MGHHPVSMRELIAAALRCSGLPLLARHGLGRKRATILLYHDPTSEVLDRHLDYLRRRYHFVTLDQVVDALAARGEWDLPPRALAVTLDDGHAGNARLAPVFRRYGVRPTINVCSQVVATRRRFWFAAGADGASALKRMPHAERLRRLEEAIGFRPDREYDDDPPQALSRADLAALPSWADVGSHSRFHPVLTTCDDPECEREIVQSKQEIEHLIGGECRHFAFPNGDYADRELELVRRAGYRSGRSVDVGWNARGADLRRLRVLGVTDDASIHVLAAQLSGVPMYLRYLLRGSLSGRSPKIRLA